jgi:hypothetical protein
MRAADPNKWTCSVCGHEGPDVVGRQTVHVGLIPVTYDGCANHYDDGDQYDKLVEWAASYLASQGRLPVREQLGAECPVDGAARREDETRWRDLRYVERAERWRVPR